MSDSYEGTPSADSYYERLGVERSASDEEVNRASKRAKRAVHPDNNSSEQATAEREFDRVTDASDALTDSGSRAAYDTFIDDQGPDTGTELYEEWDAGGRPRPPSEWLSEPRSASSSTTTSASATTTTDSTATDTSRARTQEERRPNQRQRRSEQRTTEQAGRAAADATADATGQQAAAEGDTAGDNTTPSATPNRAPESVLGEDPEEMYSKYVLDSDAEWGSPEAAPAGTSQQDSNEDTVTARYVPTPIDRFVRVVVNTPLGSLLAVSIPKSRLLRGAIAVVWLAVAVVFGPVVELLAGLPFVLFPRIGPWLYTPLAAVVLLAPTAVPLETSAGVVAVLVLFSIGYYLLVRGSRLDPYAR
ncbi:J domain-containing protein [Halonotius terrestris]|uniref:J domain-containing protein n=1 Tax=Halonotius terrestris TaxID=2487750 RepID=A0A8J8PEF1_9EURY|nr:J domain-containing protein [Halonotius terrestris]TQQ83780.1 J domain-containing protein [Halonotius terrestris]